jgi:hypothetical protein
LVVLALLAAPALADQPSKGIPQLSPFMLLYNKDVQKDLNLTADQINKLTQEMDAQKSTRQGFSDLNDNERNAKTKEWNQRVERIVNETLKSDQSRRLRQIACQVYGPICFCRTECADELKLTPDQRAKCKQIVEDTWKQASNNFKPNGDRSDAMKKRSDMVNRAKNQMMSLLTSAQKDTWKQMCGSPFTGEIKYGAGRWYTRAN